jgi:hypothetical protein
MNSKSIIRLLETGMLDASQVNWKVSAGVNMDIAYGSAGTTTALLLGGGTSALPVTTSTASKNFLAFYCKTTATTGGSDTRGAYLKVNFAGATTGGGETLRAYSTVTAAVGTVRGAHISLGMATGGSVSGLGTALSCTLEVPGATLSTGTFASIEGQVSVAASGALPASHGIFRASVIGDGTACATVKNLIDVDVLTGCVGNKSAALLVCNADVTNTGAYASAGALAVRVQGTRYWIPYYAL